MSTPPAKTTKPLTVLVLDDQKTWRNLVKVILENELGISPVVASSGQAMAFAFIREKIFPRGGA